MQVTWRAPKAEFLATDLSIPFPLHLLCAIPPVTCTLWKLRLSVQERLLRLPPLTLLRSHLSVSQAALWPSDINPPTRLTSLLYRSFPSWFSPAPPFRSLWSHPQVVDASNSKPTNDLLSFSKDAAAPLPSTSFSLYNQLTSRHAGHRFLLYRVDQLIAHRWTATPDRTGALLTALADGLESMHNFVFDHPLRVFLHNCAISHSACRLSKRKYLSLASRIASMLDTLLSDDPAAGLSSSTIHPGRPASQAGMP